MATELSRQKAAQAWCKPTTQHKAMDVELAEAFSEILDEVWSKPWLGNATTGELIEEIKARVDLQYRTVGLSNDQALEIVKEGQIQRAKQILGSGFYREAKPGNFGRSEWLDLLMACQDGRATCLRVLEIIEREMDLKRPSMDKMVDSFLAWPLPDSVCSDLCVTKPAYQNRSGTNLLTATEARQMLEHILKGYGGAPSEMVDRAEAGN